MQRNSTINKALSEVRRRHYFEKRYDRQLEKSFLGMSYVKLNQEKNLSQYDTPSTYYSNRISSTAKRGGQWLNEEFESSGQKFRDGKEIQKNEIIPYDSYWTPQKIKNYSESESGIKQSRSYGNTEVQKDKEGEEEKDMNSKDEYYDEEEFEENKEANDGGGFDEDLEEIYEEKSKNRNKNSSSYSKDQDSQNSEEESSKDHGSMSSERGTYGSSSENQNYQENGFEQLQQKKQKKYLIRSQKGKDHQDSLLAGQHNKAGKIGLSGNYEFQNEDEQQQEEDQREEEEISFRNLRDVAQINSNTNGFNFLNLTDNERRPMTGQGPKRKTTAQHNIKGSLIVQARRRALSEDRNRQSGSYDHMKNSNCDKAQTNFIYSKIRCPRYLDISSKEANTVPNHSESIDFAVMLESVKRHGTFFYLKHNTKTQQRRSLLDWNKPVHIKKTNQLSLPKHLNDLNHQPDFNYRRCHCAAGVPDSPRNLYKNAIKCESKFYQNSFIRNEYF